MPHIRSKLYAMQHSIMFARSAQQQATMHVYVCVCVCLRCVNMSIGTLHSTLHVLIFQLNAKRQRRFTRRMQLPHTHI